MSIASNVSLVDALRQYRLLEPTQLAEAESLQTHFPDPKSLTEELIRRSWLTPYQASELLQGRGQELLLGSYVLLEKLDEGGMGQVFKARNWKLGRVVAVKLIRKQRLDNSDVVRRFEREVRSAAALSHPNIVLAYDADQVDGKHLLVMEFIEGTDLAKLVKKHGPLPVERACEYARQVALGLQHAHERGLVHRDIKPHNLLLTADGKTVKILDMGLARLDPLQRDDETSVITRLGTVIGTPDYIAPEQALESHAADIRADLYSLGCTFYFLLTGQVPFAGGNLLQKLNRHQHEEAPALETIRKDIPPSVSSVVCKLMAKKPEARYQTPAEVAMVLAAGLASNALTTVRVASATTSDQIEIVSALNWSDVVRPAQADGKGKGPHRRTYLKMAAGLGAALLGTLGGWLLWPKRQEGMAILTPPPEPPPIVEPPPPSPLDHLDPAQIPAEERVKGQPKELVAVLGERRQRHWGQGLAIACSPDGKRVASGGTDGTVRLWDAATMHELHALAVIGPVRSLAFSSDSRLLACDTTASLGRMWVMTGEQPTPQPILEDVGSEVKGVAFSPKDDWFAAGCADGKIRLWDLKGKLPCKPTAVIEAAGPVVTALAFALDGKTMASGSGGFLQLWDVVNGSLRERYKKEIGKAVHSLAFSPSDGKVLATSGDDLRLWNRLQAEPVSQRIEPVTGSLAFSPDGGTVATGVWEGVRLWRVKGIETTRFAVTEYYPRLANVAVAFAPDGKTFYSSGDDGVIHTWDLTPQGITERSSGRGHIGALYAIAFTPDDRSLAATGFGGHILKWDLTGPQPAPPVLIGYGAGYVGTLVFAQEGKLLAASGLYTGTHIVDLSGKEPRFIHTFPEATGHHSTTLAVAPTNKELAVAFTNETVVHRWKCLPDGKFEELAALKDHPYSSRLAYSLDGTTLASASEGVVRVEKLDDEGPDRLVVLKGHQGAVSALAYAPEGRLLASGDERFVRLWDPYRSTQLLVALKGHEGPVAGLAFGRKGELLASVDHAGIVIVWDVAKETKAHRWKLGGPVYGVAFARDGRHLATANGNGTAYILRLPS